VGGGEIRGGAHTFAYPDGTVYGCYGCTDTALGRIPWQRALFVGSTGWTTIESAQNIRHPDFHSDNKWTVGDLPSPWVVQHVCDADHARGC
jgi:hypothetical protein